jgi:hypothetical protein
MTMDDMDRIGRRSVLTCPDCGDTMWEVDDAKLVRYRCHVGHAYTSELMSVALDETLRRTLATALRALDERVALATKLSTDARQRGHSQPASSWATEAEEFAQQAASIRDSIKRIDEMAPAWRPRQRSLPPRPSAWRGERSDAPASSRSGLRDCAQTRAITPSGTQPTTTEAVPALRAGKPALHAGCYFVIDAIAVIKLAAVAGFDITLEFGHRVRIGSVCTCPV